jgi:hypothetical protein
MPYCWAGRMPPAGPDGPRNRLGQEGRTAALPARDGPELAWSPAGCRSPSWAAVRARRCLGDRAGPARCDDLAEARAGKGAQGLVGSLCRGAGRRRSSGPLMTQSIQARAA